METTTLLSVYCAIITNHSTFRETPGLCIAVAMYCFFSYGVGVLFYRGHISWWALRACCTNDSYIWLLELWWLSVG